MLVALAKLLISSFVCFGLLSAWATTSPRHWFVRTGVLVAALSLLLLIPAYEPVVVFALQGLTVAAGVQAARWWRRRKEGHGLLPRRTRFSLATVLLLTVYVAIAAAVIAKLPEQGFAAWLSMMLVGVVAGIATLLGLWIVHGQLARWWRRVALRLVLFLGISLPLLWDDWVFSLFGFDDGSATLWILVIVCVTSFSGVLLWLRSGVASGNSAWFSSRWKRVIASATLLLSAIAIGVPSASVYYQLMTPLPIPQTVLPDPNGWDDLVAAGEMIESSSELRTINFYDTATQDQLSVAVKAIAPAYEQLKIGFDKQVSCPIDYNSSDINTDVMSSMRTLARALAARGHLAKLESRFDEAADFFLEGIQHGYALRRGGMMVDSLVGSACSGVGRSGLYSLQKELSAAHCLRLIAELEEFERLSESVDDVLFRDRVWSLYAYGWQGHFMQILEDTSGVGPWEFRPRFECAFSRERAEMRLLRLELAIQAWRKIHGSLPESLNELIPEIMPEIPVDPFDAEGRLIQYRRTEENTDVGYILYSVGTNGIDDGGVAPDEEDMGGFETGDLRLDIRYAPEPEIVEEEE